MWYLTVKDASLSYHNLKLDDKPAYFMEFACQFGRHRYMRLPFWATLGRDMFQRKTDEIFRELPNVFVIVDYILVVGYSKDHGTTLCRVFQICRKNLKFSTDKFHFRCMSFLSFGKIISRHRMWLDPQKLHMFTDML